MKRITLLRTFIVLLFVGVAAGGVIWHTGWGTLSSFGLGSIAHICPVGALESMFASKTFISTALICLGLFSLVIVLLGRFFCSWCCPVPLLRKLTGTDPKKIASKTTAVEALNSKNTFTRFHCETGNKNNSEVWEGKQERKNFLSSEKLQKNGPFFVLGAALASSAIFSFPVFCLICPVGLTFAFIIGMIHLLKFNEPSITPLVVVGILFIEIFFLRRWCHYACPIGAFITLISRLNKTFQPKIQKEKCLTSHGLACRICSRSCPENIDLRKPVPVEDSARCLKCGICAEKCPVTAISFPIFERKLKNKDTTPSQSPTTISNFPSRVQPKVVIPKDPFKEISETFSLPSAIHEGSRCIGCGLCVESCPQHNPIPQILEAISKGDVKTASGIVYQPGKLPEICARLCPEEKSCMAACPIGTFSDPINIHALLCYVSDRALARPAGRKPRLCPNAASVAVIGAGPAGLAAADIICSKGHRVTVFDKENQIGGLLNFGIPSFKLEKERILTRRKLYEKNGITFHLGKNISTAEDWQKILDSFDSVLISTGAEIPVPLNTRGADRPFVFQGIDYLRSISRHTSEAANSNYSDPLHVANKRVAVLGIGGTALDCARTAVRQGASSVICIFRKSLLEAHPPKDDYRYALQEGVEFMDRTVLDNIESDGTIQYTRMNQERSTLNADVVIVAYGFKGPDTTALREAGVIVTKGSIKTNLSHVFIAGDAMSGPGYVSSAIESAERAAGKILIYLKDNYKNTNYTSRKNYEFQ